MTEMRSGAAASPLVFDSDKGASRAKWLALALLVAIIAWMGSGFVFPADEAPTEAEEAAAPAPVAVTVMRSAAQPVLQVFRAEGQALPDRETMLRTETTGEIAEVLVQKGADVAPGQIIARFVPAQRAADLTRAREEVARAKREFQNAETLLARGASTADRVAENRATLAAAEAQLSAAEEAITNTELRAPFAGRLENLTIDEGEFVQTGVEVARIVDTSPLTISVRIPQQSLARISEGQPAEVRFITGETRPGTVSFLATSADAETRTFLAEITVENGDAAIPAGISAEVLIPTGEVTGHFLSPAIMSLGTDGTLGIKTVTDDDTVAFFAVEIIRAESAGVWVAGLPPEVRIITVGQGFVTDGEQVTPAETEALTQ